MIVRLKEKTPTTVGILEPGIVDMPVADVLRLVKQGVVDILEEEDQGEIPPTRRNAMIKTYMVR